MHLYRITTKTKYSHIKISRLLSTHFKNKQTNKQHFSTFCHNSGDKYMPYNQITGLHGDLLNIWHCKLRFEPKKPAKIASFLAIFNEWTGIHGTFHHYHVHFTSIGVTNTCQYLNNSTSWGFVDNMTVENVCFEPKKPANSASFLALFMLVKWHTWCNLAFLCAIYAASSNQHMSEPS